MKDPVCGVAVTAESKHHVEHEGEVLYFCGVACLNKFSTAPGRYLAKEVSDKNDACCRARNETAHMKCNHHKAGISLLGVGHATSLTLAISFALCVIFDLLMPDHAMYETWQKLLPGFEWLSWKSLFWGMLEAYGYGWYFALIWVPIYNFVVLRGQKKEFFDG